MIAHLQTFTECAWGVNLLSVALADFVHATIDILMSTAAYRHYSKQAPVMLRLK
jgi:hypothetical protein